MFVEPMTDKATETTIKAFGRILTRTPLRPIRTQSDKGREFSSAKFKKFMKDNGIIFNTTNNPDIKASICERSIRTLKGHIFKYLTHNNTYTFIDHLQDFVKAYNNTFHRTIKMAPSEVNDKNILQVYANIVQSHGEKKKRSKKGKIKVGDYVRLTKEKKVFSKGYTKTYTEEIFRVDTLIPRVPPVYRLKDLAGEEITGTFYEPELQKVIFDETTPKMISAIIKERGKGKNLQYYVRYRNYPPAFDTWVKASTITK